MGYNYNYNTRRTRRRMRLRAGRVIGLLIALIVIGTIPFVIVHFWQKNKDTVAVDSIKEDSITESESTLEDTSSEPNEGSSDDDISGQSSDAVKDEPDIEDENSTDAFYEEAMPILVNLENFIPEGYDPDVVEIGDGYSLNRKAAAAWQEMRSAAAADNISLWVVSAYRSNEKQTQNFNNTLEQHVAAGRTRDDAYALTAAYIAIPGTSEHTLGLAVDIISLNESFENTREFAWLSENCARFGFVLRYPKNKTDITGINYEPWHYRYVGTNHAETIMKNGMALEEYLNDYLSNSD